MSNESEPEKWLVVYAIVPTSCEQGRSMVMMNGINRWHTMKEANGVHGFRRREKQYERGRALSDLAITSDGCAKEVISHLDAS